MISSRFRYFWFAIKSIFSTSFAGHFQRNVSFITSHIFELIFKIFNGAV